MKAIEWTDTTIALVNVRRPSMEERSKWARPDSMFYLVGEEMEIKAHWSKLPTFMAVTQHRICDGSMPGCSNRVWLISDREWDAIKAEADMLALTEEPHSVEAKPISEEVQALVKQYGTSEKAWDAGDERAWALLHKAEIE